MPYYINNTKGDQIATITDGTIDNTTSLILFGKSYSGFGEALNENLVKLLEHSSSASAPVAPVKGELWYDESAGSIKVYNGTAFVPTGGARASATEPTSSATGDLWLDTDDNQVYAYTGSSWKLVGPVWADGQTQSGWKIDTVTYSGGTHVVSSMYAANTRVAILSKNEFTPDATWLAANTGFPKIFPGITLNNLLGASFKGSSAQAGALEVSSTTNTSATVIAGGNFVRADTSDAMAGSLTIQNDVASLSNQLSIGRTTGSTSDFEIEVDSSNNVILRNPSQDKNLSVTINDGGVTKTPIAITGTTGNIALTGDVTITGNLTVSGEHDTASSNVSTYDDAFIKVNTGNAEADAGLIVETSDTDDARLFYQVSTNNWVAGENQAYSQVITLADATIDGHTNKEKVLKTNASGNVKVTTATLGAVGAIAEGDTSNLNVPTTGAVVTFGDLWGGSAKTVSTVLPTSGDGNDGDFWFVREV